MQNTSFNSRRRSMSAAKPAFRSRSGGGGGGRPMGGRKNNRRGTFIHPSKFINKAVKQAEQVQYDAKHVFADFPFSTVLQGNIDKKGYTQPSPIQDQAIMPILEGRDVIGLANTGTGKTAAFILPIIERLSGITARPTVLIMAPTRELAEQIDEQFRSFAQGMKLYSTLCVGGMNIERQIRELRRRPHVVIGTPGRLKDLLQRNVFNLNDMTTLVLDEADRMLDMGFINDIRAIVSKMPSDRQTLFFSATITPTIESLVHAFLKDPVTVSVRTSETSEHVEQDIVEAGSKEEKLQLLTDMLSDAAYDRVLVFGETKFGVQRLADALTRAGHPSTAIHGNKTQPQRQRALRAFKASEVKVLVATDVAARGLDIPNVSHVINFDQPATYEDYIHRIGRTGRGGARGIAYTFVEAPRTHRNY